MKRKRERERGKFHSFYSGKLSQLSESVAFRVHLMFFIALNFFAKRPRDSTASALM